MGTEDLPYRVVDAHNQGWHNTSNEPGGKYSADYGFNRGLTAYALDALARERGPLRPVLPITDADQAQLFAVFARCRRKTVTTVAAALEEVFHDLRESQGGLADASHSYEYAMRTLLAGREGSWESEVLKEIVLFGNTLNLAPGKRGRDNSVEGRREAGPSRRVDVEARRELAEVFTRWVTGPDRYTEVAETLARAVSEYADTTVPTGGEMLGWRSIADQWLQPAGLAHEDFVSCYRLLYSLSQHFDTSLL